MAEVHSIKELDAQRIKANEAMAQDLAEVAFCLRGIISVTQQEIANSHLDAAGSALLALAEKAGALTDRTVKKLHPCLVVCGDWEDWRTMKVEE